MNVINKILLVFVLQLSNILVFGQCETYLQKAETEFAQKNYKEAKRQYLNYQECKPNAIGVDEKIAECERLLITQTNKNSDTNKSETFPCKGLWKLTGKDYYNSWTADLVIEEKNNDKFRGYFNWYRMGNFSGTEYFNGEYNSQNKIVTIKGTRLENSKNLALGTYVADLDNNGYDFVSGIWGGTNASVGTWQATFFSENTITSISSNKNAVPAPTKQQTYNTSNFTKTGKASLTTFEGKNYIGNINANSGFRFTIYSNNSTTANLLIVYRSDTRGGKLIVNGATHDIDFTSTNWKWGTKTIQSIILHQGVNTIEFYGGYRTSYAPDIAEITVIM